MQLGKDTGSFVNHIMSKETRIPSVGDGATILHWSDRDPATVISVEKNDNFVQVVVQMDDYKRVDHNGMSEMQEYEYTANPDGVKLVYRLYFKTPVWFRYVYNTETNRWNKRNRNGISFGSRRRYFDYSF